MEMIIAFSLVNMLATAWFASGHLRMLHGFHYPVHSSCADMHAIVTPKNAGDPISAVSFIVVNMDFYDDLFDILIFFYVGRWNFVKVLVIGVPINLQDTTQCIDRMLETQLMNGF